MKKQILKINFYPIFLFCILAMAHTVLASNIPEFVLRDPKGNQIQTSDFHGKRLILVGCFPEDAETCRKSARKIYWLMEKKSMQYKIQIERIGFISVQGIPKPLLETLSNHLNNPGYENIYFDEKGYFKDSLKKGFIFIQGFDAKGNLKFKEYKSEVFSNDINRYFQLLR